MRYFLILVLSLLINAGCTPCSDVLSSFFTPEHCADLQLKFSSARMASRAACTGVPKSRKVSIACPPSGAAACAAAASSSAYYFIFAPNNGGGVFIDTTAGTIQNCNELWTALSSLTPPSDLIGAYFSDPTVDLLNCTDLGGCTGTSSSCISGWDPVSISPTGIAVGISNSTKMLACGFIDVPPTVGVPAGPPPNPGSNLPSIALPNQFNTQTVTGTVNFTSWQNY